MKMSELEKEAIHARNKMNDSINQLVTNAVNDSETYMQAIDKLKQFRWSLTGNLSNVMIDTAIERVKLKALNSKVKRNC